jgi:hypothetical protein
MSFIYHHNRRPLDTFAGGLFSASHRYTPFFSFQPYLNTFRYLCQAARVESKSNEIKAVPKLIEALALEGVVIAFDAMNTQKNY